MLVGKRVLICCLMLALLIYSLWYSSCSGLVYMELYSSKLLLLVRLRKPKRTCSPWEVHTKSSPCVVVVRCLRAIHWHPGILATWMQEPLSVLCGFHQVHIWAATIQSVMWAVQSPQEACMKPIRACTRPIGSSRPAELVRNTYWACTGI